MNKSKSALFGASALPVIILGLSGSALSAATSEGCPVCVTDCALVLDPDAACREENCGSIGICSGAVGDCGSDLDDEDEQLECYG